MRYLVIFLPSSISFQVTQESFFSRYFSEKFPYKTKWAEGETVHHPRGEWWAHRRADYSTEKVILGGIVWFWDLLEKAESSASDKKFGKLVWGGGRQGRVKGALWDEGILGIFVCLSDRDLGF